MDNFEKINDFMEGELDTNAEQELFSEMALNDSLRGEFKNLLAISATIKNNRKAFAKNEKTKKAVFAAIGLSIPVADGATSLLASGGAGASVGYGLKTLLATGLLSALATAILIYSFGGSHSQSSVQHQPNYYSYNRLAIEAPKPTKVEAPIVSARDLGSSSSSKYQALYSDAIAENNKLRQQLNEKAIIISEQAKELQQSTENNSRLQSSLNSFKSDYDKMSSAYQAQNSQLAEMTSQLQKANESISLRPSLNLEPTVSNDLASDHSSSWSAEWKGSQTFNTVSQPVPNTDVSQFNNNSLSVLYNFASGLSVGAELRQETFLLEFTGEDINKVMYLYRQEPNFTTLSLLSRYTYDMSETLDPFAQITFGGNKIGVVGRLMGGFMYSPYQNLNLILGFEYNNMSFQYQGNRFNSGKVGINYGVSFTF